MGHAVHHRDAGGETHLEEVATLASALELVERLRDDGSTDVRVYREVPVEVRTYHKAIVVEAPAASDASDDGGEPAAGVGAADEPRQEPVVASWTGRTGPPPGAMPLVPPVTVRDDLDEEPSVDQPEHEHRRPLFSRG